MTGTHVLRITALWLAAAGGAISTPAAPPKTPADIVKVKADLVVANLAVERTGFAAGGAHQVRLAATVRCASPAPATCGPFKILAEYRDGKGGPWLRLGEAGVASLSSGGVTVVVPTATRFFDDTVALGRIRSYRVTVDASNQVTESNETNNTATESYRATGCEGIDLVLTQVSMRRTATGGTLVSVWVKNRCVEPCVAEISYVIDESEAVPGAVGVAQVIGSRIEGETEVGPLGNVVAAGRAGEDATYTVRITARGGACTETSTANNSCRVTIRAGEASRTVRCNAVR